jgi:hypothetical protein
LKNVPRVLKWILGGLLVFEIIYVAAGIFLVQSGQVDRWINNKPEKRTITFDSAWTFVPGVAHVSGARVVNQGRGNQLEIVVDKARAFVSPLELLVKRVHIMGLEAQGVEFRFRKRPQTMEEAGEREETAPAIEGIEFEPYDGPTQEEEDRAKAEKRKAEGEPPKREGEGWTIVFTGSKVRDVRDVWIDAIRLQGTGKVAASVTVGPGRDKQVSIRSADVRYPEAAVVLEGSTVAEDLALRVEGMMERFLTKRDKGKALLRKISAEVELEGRSTGRLLNGYFSKAGWLEFQSEPRRANAHVRVEQGKLLAGSRLELAEGPLEAEFAGFIVQGQAAARLETVPGDGEVAIADVEVSFTDYGMRRLAEGDSVMKGTDLLIEARSPADLMLMPPDDFDGKLEFGEAMFPDLTFVNEMLPQGGGIEVRSGRGSVSGGFEIKESAAVQGSVKILTEELVVGAAGVENAGAVEVMIEVPDGNLNDLKFGVDRTRVEFHDFAFTSAGSTKDRPEWQGHIEVTRGTLSLGEGVGGALVLTFSDTRPLVAFLSRDKPLKGWQENLLMLEEVRGEGVVEMTRGTWTIGHFGIRGGKLDVRMRASMGPKGIFGKALAQYGILKAGIGIAGDNRDLKILRAGSWYKKDDIPGTPPLIPEHAEPGDEEEAGQAADAGDGATEAAG